LAPAVSASRSNSSKLYSSWKPRSSDGSSTPTNTALSGWWRS